MIGNGDGGRNGAGIGVLARAVADAVPGIVEQLCASNIPRVHREALALLERPLLAHVLALTGGRGRKESAPPRGAIWAADAAGFVNEALYS